MVFLWVNVFQNKTPVASFRHISYHFYSLTHSPEPLSLMICIWQMNHDTVDLFESAGGSGDLKPGDSGAEIWFSWLVFPSHFPGSWLNSNIKLWTVLFHLVTGTSTGFPDFAGFTFELFPKNMLKICTKYWGNRRPVKSGTLHYYFYRKTVFPRRFGTFVWSELIFLYRCTL